MKDYKKYLNPATKVPMMEVLLTDDLVNFINLTQKKISVKHYLNVYLFPTGEDKNGQPKYPLYFRLIFNKQSVKIKSAINTSYSLTEFQQLEITELNLIRREALALTHIVSSIYCNTIKAFSETLSVNDSGTLLSQDEFLTNEVSNKVKQVKQEFDINQVFSSFDYSQYELHNLVEQKLIDSMANYAKSINHFEEYEGIFKQSNGLNSYQLLQFLKSEKSEWKKFEKQYHPFIWFFNLHYFQFKNQSMEYKALGATQVDLQYLDFKKIFLEYYPTDDFWKMTENLKKLLNN